MRTANARLQRLMPHLFCGAYVVAKATTHKHSRVDTQTHEGPQGPTPQVVLVSGQR